MKQSLSLEPLGERVVPAVVSAVSEVAPADFGTTSVERPVHENEQEGSSYTPPYTLKAFNPQPEPPEFHQGAHYGPQKSRPG